ncbi:MAG: DUF2786 domain-containing protein [Spirochaetaceae bacterium]|jgi:hypothetical protein|nr:DUF2786 domain-containing protein [Spirochaetaceae bacterium]
MTETDKIKDKIKKLFALSKSPNAHEASIALEMAQKLMAEYGIKRNDVGEFEVIKEVVKGNGGEKPPRYEVYLVGEIAEAFGCRNAYGMIKLPAIDQYGFNTYAHGYSFVGLEHRVKIALFITEVLLRKLKKARNEYIKRLNRVRTRGNKIKRADEFCLGWAVTVVSKLHKFTNAPDEQAAIDNYVAGLSWGKNLKSISRTVVKKSGIKDFVNGRRAAADVEIQHGVTGKEAGSRLLGGNV